MIDIKQIICYTKLNIIQHTLASFIPVSFVLGLSSTRKAARLAVYEATIIIANPAQTIPRTLAEKLRGVPEWKKLGK